MDNFLSLNVTYAALESAFYKLGFRISVKETHRLYEHDASGSIHAMPLNIPMDQPVRPAHLSSARHAVVAFGVADQATLERLLTEQAPTEQVSAPAKAAARTAPRRRSRQPGSPQPPVPAEAH